MSSIPVYKSVIEDFFDIASDRCQEPGAMAMPEVMVPNAYGWLSNERDCSYERAYNSAVDSFIMKRYDDEQVIVIVPMLVGDARLRIIIFQRLEDMQDWFEAMHNFLTRTRVVDVTLRLQIPKGGNEDNYKWDDLLGSEFQKVVNIESVTKLHDD